jgi:hypothetical protein
MALRKPTNQRFESHPANAGKENRQNNRTCEIEEGNQAQYN